VSNALGAAGELAIRSLIERAPLASSLAQSFKAKGFTLALVGGPVRDALLGRLGNEPALHLELLQANVVIQLLK